MGGSFERLTASGKPTHYFGTRKSRSALYGLYVLLPVSLARAHEAWLRQLMAVFWSPVKTGRGSPVRLLVFACESSHGLTVGPITQTNRHEMGCTVKPCKDSTRKRGQQWSKTHSHELAKPRLIALAGDKHKALSPRSGVPSKAKRTGDKHKALSRRAA